MGPVIVFTAWKIAAGDTGALGRNTQCSFVCFLKYTLQFGESRGAGRSRRGKQEIEFKEVRPSDRCCCPVCLYVVCDAVSGQRTRGWDMGQSRLILQHRLYCIDCPDTTHDHQTHSVCHSVKMLSRSSARIGGEYSHQYAQ